MNALRQKLRYAFRRLVKSPGFTAVAVLTPPGVVGMGVAFTAMRVLVSLPYGVSAADPLMLARATRVDPMIALRAE